MTETQLLFGGKVRCADGPAGRLHRAVVAPEDGALTHLAVKPDGLQGGRLVPAALIAYAQGEEIRLGCMIAEFVRLEAAEETAEQHTASWPYAEDEQPGRFPSGFEGVERDTGYGNRTVIRDRIPDGGVEVHRGEIVSATDGEAGRLLGLVIDLPDTHVTHLLLSRGRLFGGRTRIAVPIANVTNFGDGIQLNLTTQHLRTLPAT